MNAKFYTVDYQVHSYCSHDGRSTIQEQCMRAVDLGLDELGFSEHKDFDPLDPVVDYFNYDNYLREIDAARMQWGDRLHIRAGVEIDYQVWFEDEIAKYLSQHAFDFVIGSVHYVRREMLMTAEFNRWRTASSAYADYFRAVRDSVAFGQFDIVGHLEYANRRGLTAWGPYHAEDYHEELVSLFEKMVTHDIPLEINTAGMHQGLGITYPVEDTVRIYTECGGRLLSIGSDAHHPDQLAHAYSIAAEMALRHGLTHVCTWTGRERREIPLVSRTVERAVGQDLGLQT